MSPENLKSGDTDELEALFDQIAEQRVWDASEPEPSAAVADQAQMAQAEPGAIAAQEQAAELAASDEPHDVFHRVGMLTRRLHDALHELGYDKNVESAVNSLPDARARLTYIADLTGKAADKVLASVEACQNANDVIADRAQELSKQWERLYNNEMSLEEFKAHAKANQEFVQSVAQSTQTVGGQLTEIMLAQDFHDLTGQVVNRIANMAQNLEDQLVELLLDTTPPDQRKQVEEQWLTGPAMNAQGRTDVCANQGQVDDLLESLGF